jgi:hypothetical protein
MNSESKQILVDTICILHSIKNGRYTNDFARYLLNNRITLLSNLILMNEAGEKTDCPHAYNKNGVCLICKDTKVGDE